MKLTTAEAGELIAMLKEHTHEVLKEFPKQKGMLQFDVIGEKLDGHEFVVNIQRKGINSQSCTYLGRTKSNVILLRLDINPSGRHRNPSDGAVLVGNHLHIYTEEYDDKEAIPFHPENEHLYDICLEFFKRFNIISDPLVEYQEKLIDV